MSYLESLFSLEGQVAVIIGGTGHLCGSMGVALARAGAEVVLVGRNPESAIDKLAAIDEFGGKSWFFQADVTKRDELQKLLDQVVARSGKVDILVNGAGAGSSTPFLKITDEEYKQLVDINFSSVFMACQIFGEYFIHSLERNSIINVGSMAGMLPVSGLYGYSAAKAAVHNLTKNLAREWAEHDIRINTLVPGFFPAGQATKQGDESRALEILRHTPMSRFGNAEELTGATLLLASNIMGSFITGTEIVVDGGFSSMTI
ncbi:SDR family oxidoreductase [Verrucomicrobiaceae bacterium N1E253]|uniref:SDR family oxidoreductase n=1 Tax=Oceaniferula marina TaxID=2748318 RepID=A0A851GBT7_9BACT|nr:SDR family oxidoreductase [Oceaniferula marina]NWK54886.1 SDR family oxidoreductase [Oceaniferula marina]